MKYLTQKMLSMMVLLTITLVVQSRGTAQDTYSLAGRVTNVLTDNPVGNVIVVVSNGTAVVTSTTTDLTGYFIATNLPTEGPYQVAFSLREYGSAYITSILASVTDINVALEPNEISTPAAPFANAGPQNIYIDWAASPETAIKGYNLYRTETDALGTFTGETIKLNGTSETLLGDLLESAAYIDENTETGVLYVYQVQVISSVDRPSALSEPSDPVKANYLTLSIPTVYAPQLLGMSFAHPISGNLLVRIPVAVESIYDVVAKGMKLAVDLPANAFLHDTDNPIMVLPSGLTRQVGLTYRTEIVEDIIRVFIEADGAIPLYGAGALFYIFAVPATMPENDCVPIQLNAPSTFFNVLIGDEYVPVALEIFDGVYCNSSECIYGDVTNDGRVNVADAGALLQYLVGKRGAPTGHPCFPDVADINCDSRVDVADVRLILRYITLDFEGPAPTPSTLGAAFVSLDIESNESTAVVYIALEGVEDLSGFSVSLGYPADYLNFSAATTGDGLATDFTLESDNQICGENSENGLVKISATTQKPGVCTEKTIIAVVEFSLANASWTPDTLPVRITDFTYNDAEGYTPRHTDPAAPKGYGQSLGQAAALFCTLMDADTMTPIKDGIISIQPAHHSPVSNNTNGVYAMPAIEGGSYNLTATSPLYNGSVQNLYIGKGETVSREMYLVMLPAREGEPEGEPTAEGENEGEGEDVEGEGEVPSEGEKDDTKKKRILFCGTSDSTPSDFACDIALIMLVALTLVSQAKRQRIIRNE